MINPNHFYVRLPVKTSVNVRDLGGYPGDHGRPTKFKAFVRSGDLTFLSDSDKAFLIDYGIKTVIDLRTDHEQRLNPNPFETCVGVNYYHNPFFLGNISDMPFDYDSADPMGDLYISIFEENSHRVASAVKTIVNAADGGVLFHCTAGKDRTGILSFVLLDLAGVCDEDIIANYKITDSYYIPHARESLPDFSRIPPVYLQSRAETMERVIKYIKEKRGGVKNYLLDSGVTEAETASVKNRLIYEEDSYVFPQ